MLNSILDIEDQNLEEEPNTGQYKDGAQKMTSNNDSDSKNV